MAFSIKLIHLFRDVPTSIPTKHYISAQTPHLFYTSHV